MKAFEIRKMALSRSSGENQLIFRNEQRQHFRSYTLCFDQPVPRDFHGNLKAKFWEIML